MNSQMALYDICMSCVQYCSNLTRDVVDVISSQSLIAVATKDIGKQEKSYIDYPQLP